MQGPAGTVVCPGCSSSSPAPPRATQAGGQQSRVLTALAWGCSMAEGACPELWPHPRLDRSYSVARDNLSKAPRAFLGNRAALHCHCRQIRGGTAPLQVLLETPFWTKTLRCCGDPKDREEFSGQFLLLPSLWLLFSPSLFLFTGAQTQEL